MRTSFKLIPLYVVHYFIIINYESNSKLIEKKSCCLKFTTNDPNMKNSFIDRETELIWFLDALFFVVTHTKLTCPMMLSI